MRKREMIPAFFESFKEFLISREMKKMHSLMHEM